MKGFLGGTNRNDIVFLWEKAEVVKEEEQKEEENLKEEEKKNEIEEKSGLSAEFREDVKIKNNPLVVGKGKHSQLNKLQL